MGNQNSKIVQNTENHPENGLPDGWNITVLFKAVDINPKRSLKKNINAKCVPMEALNPFERKIRFYENKEFKGGSKFSNCDTIMARITPCLENGKTAYIDILEDNEIAFGSTEFIVLSSKPNITNDKFVYYLSISPEIREKAIQSMNGTSGRQRVQTEILANTNILLPPLNEQIFIASILSSLDDKIELNHKMNETLEKIAQAIFKNWFIDFEFPDENGNPYKSSGGKMIETEFGEIPKEWNAGKLRNLIELAYGKALKSEDRVKGVYPVIGSNGIVGYHNSFLVQGPGIVIGRKGTIGEVIWINENFFPIDTTFYIKDALGVSGLFYYYFLLKEQEFKKISADSAVPGLNRNQAMENQAIIPTKMIIEKFNLIVMHLFKRKFMITNENNSLTEIRDNLLPKLMSGKIRVKA